MNNDVIMAIIVIALMVQFAYTFAMVQRSHNREREAWNEANQKLLDRFFAKDFNEYKSFEVAEKVQTIVPTKPPDDDLMPV